MVTFLAPTSRTLAGHTLFYSTLVPPGFSMIANQLNYGSNTVAEVLRLGVVEGTAVYKFDPANQAFTVDVFQGGAWLDPTQTLAPGEGAFIFNPTQSGLTVTFQGSVTELTNSVVQLTNQIPAGLSIRSSIMPLSGQLDTKLSFPAAAGDIVYRFNPASRTFLIYTFDFGSWTAPPLVNVGESFFVWEPAPATWVQTYNQIVP